MAILKKESGLPINKAFIALPISGLSRRLFLKVAQMLLADLETFCIEEIKL